jgi:hypothetical protein
MGECVCFLSESVCRKLRRTARSLNHPIQRPNRNDRYSGVLQYMQQCFTVTSARYTVTAPPEPFVLHPRTPPKCCSHTLGTTQDAKSILYRVKYVHILIFQHYFNLPTRTFRWEDSLLHQGFVHRLHCAGISIL